MKRRVTRNWKMKKENVSKADMKKVGGGNITFSDCSELKGAERAMCIYNNSRRLSMVTVPKKEN